MSDLFITWGKFQQRSELMKEDFDFEIVYIFNDTVKNPYIKYFIYSFKTIWILFKKKPKVVWGQLPPTPLMIILYIYRLLRKNTKVVFDCHNAVFRKPWVKTPFTKKLLKSKKIIKIVHNEDVLNEYKDLLLNNTAVLLDKPDTKEVINSNTKPASSKVKILVPCSFNKDEPLELIKEISNWENDNYEFTVTGNYTKSNVTFGMNANFTGFISKEEYVKILQQTDIILGLTNEDLIQLSAANEGLVYEKPMLLSNTNTLKKLFPQGCYFVEHNIRELEMGLSHITSDLEEYNNEIKKLKKIKINNWNSQSKYVSKLVN